jgi:hypothetical protein
MGSKQVPSAFVPLSCWSMLPVKPEGMLFGKPLHTLR